MRGAKFATIHSNFLARAAANIIPPHGEARARAPNFLPFRKTRRVLPNLFSKDRRVGAECDWRLVDRDWTEVFGMPNKITPTLITHSLLVRSRVDYHDH